jgi:hypothetical protein
MFTTPTITSISKALVLAQREMGDARKDSKNPFFKSTYADLNAIREACIPVLNKYGIVVLQPTAMHEGNTYVETVLLHESGESISSSLAVVVAKQNDPQAQGSAISYARRYALKSLLNIGDSDDDGEAAMGRVASPAPSPSKTLASPSKEDSSSLLKKISSAAAVLFAQGAHTPESLTEHLKSTYSVSSKEKLSLEQAKEFFEFLDKQTKGGKLV